MQDGGALIATQDVWAQETKIMFTPENELEKSLMKAATDPAHRPQFYKDFINSEIFVIRHGPLPEKEGRTVLKEGMQLQIQPIEINEKTYLPIFSSVTRLRDTIQKEVGFLGLNALEFLKITRGADLMLNPGSAYGKEFVKEEVERLLDGTMWKPSQTYVAEKDTKILIGQPKNYPQALVDTLSRLFKNVRDVKSAYLAHYHNPEEGDPPHTLIGISAAGNWEEIVAQAGMVARDVDVPDPPVDFIHIETNESLSEYFLKGCKPFYKRKTWALF